MKNNQFRTKTPIQQRVGRIARVDVAGYRLIGVKTCFELSVKLPVVFADVIRSSVQADPIVGVTLAFVNVLIASNNFLRSIPLFKPKVSDRGWCVDPIAGR